MVSVNKQRLSCCNHDISGCWGKDFLILMEKPMHGLEAKHSGSTSWASGYQSALPPATASE